MESVVGVLLLAGQLMCAPAVDPNSPDICYFNGWCDANEYCAKPVGDCNGVGVCTPRPDYPPPPCWEPVCGCNGVTYANGWVAALEGASLRYPWSCEAGDLNHDDHVDIGDVELFAPCMTGPDVFYGSNCYEADNDYDYDVDLADFVPFQIMASPAAMIGQHGYGACERRREFCAPDDFIVETASRRLSVLHENAAYNCCKDDIAVTLSVSGSSIAMTETEVVTIPCFCICCYPVTTTVVNLDPGLYTLNYWWADDDDGLWHCYQVAVSVPE